MILILLMGIALSVSTSALAEIVGVARVIDGDTIEVAGERIRLHGIDAPEMDQACEWPDETIECGAIAKAALVDRLSGAVVRCEKQDRDRYGRIVAVCHANGTDIGQNLVRAGWALAYRRYSTAYVDAEDEARKAKRGMWMGEFIAPWDWRRSKR
jgi:endonuclease YncB( thermonuclease family)